jgi:hypothetical protein
VKREGEFPRETPRARSDRGVAVVDGERHAGHIRRVVAREVQDRGGDLLGLAEAPERVLQERVTLAASEPRCGWSRL